MLNWSVDKEGFIEEERETFLLNKKLLKKSCSNLKPDFYYFTDSDIKAEVYKKWIPLKYFKWDVFIRKFYKLNPSYIKTKQGIYLLKTKFFYVLLLETLEPDEFAKDLLFSILLYKLNNLNLPLLLSLKISPSFTYYRVIFKSFNKIKINCIILKDPHWFNLTSLRYNKKQVEKIDDSYLETYDPLVKTLKKIRFIEVAPENIKLLSRKQVFRELKKISLQSLITKNLHKQLTFGYFL